MRPWSVGMTQLATERCSDGCWSDPEHEGMDELLRWRPSRDVLRRLTEEYEGDEASRRDVCSLIGWIATRSPLPAALSLPAPARLEAESQPGASAAPGEPEELLRRPPLHQPPPAPAEATSLSLGKYAAARWNALSIAASRSAAFCSAKAPSPLRVSICTVPHASRLPRPATCNRRHGVAEMS